MTLAQIDIYQKSHNNNNIKLTEWKKDWQYSIYIDIHEFAQTRNP